MLMDEQNHFTAESDSGVADQPPKISNDSITWTASEFIDNSKNINWYLLFFVAIVAISFIVYLFTRSIFSTTAVFILGLALCYMATRKPREVHYALDNKGIVINNIDHPFSEFKSYTIVSEDGLDHIVLTSVKRLIPNKTIYFEPQDKAQIISLLGEFIPMEQISHDPIDRFMKKIGL